MAAKAMLQVRDWVVDTVPSTGWGAVLVITSQQLDILWKGFEEIPEIPVVDGFVVCDDEMLGSRQHEDGRVELFVYSTNLDRGVWGIARAGSEGLTFEAVYDFSGVLQSPWRVFKRTGSRRSSVEKILLMTVKRVLCARGVERIVKEQR